VSILIHQGRLSLKLFNKSLFFWYYWTRRTYENGFLRFNTINFPFSRIRLLNIHKIKIWVIHIFNRGSTSATYLLMILIKQFDISLFYFLNGIPLICLLDRIRSTLMSRIGRIQLHLPLLFYLLVRIRDDFVVVVYYFNGGVSLIFHPC